MSLYPKGIIVDAAKGIVEYQPRRSKVAIVGAGPLRRLVPFTDPDWVVWGINEIPQPRATAWFEMHPMSVQSVDELAWLSRQRAPVYVLEETPFVPAGVRFPIERVLETTGLTDFFSCTFAYQIALAVAEGFEEVGLFGVDLPWGNWRERVWENACVAYWIGYARGRGVRVTMPRDGVLLNYPHQYGYDYYDEKRWVENEGRVLLSLLQEKFPLERRGT